jgi:ATP-dependent Clp protease, protease subunit
MPYVPVPYIIEQTSRGERGMDIFSRLNRDRIILLGSEIDEDVANIIIGQILILDAENPEKDITLYINSPGGSVYDGLAIYDTMQFVRSPISTVCIGQAASMASFLLAAGEKGKRYVLPHARVMIHQSMGGTRGQAIDIEIYAKELKRMERMMNESFSMHTGQAIEKIEKDVDRDFYMGAEETVAYGICDRVISTPEVVR